MGKKRERVDNRGMSLVEMVVVLAFMAIIAGFAGYGLNLISKKPVEECTKKVEIALNRNRTNSMGKKEAWVEFFVEDGRVKVLEHTLSGRAGATPQETEAFIGDKDVNLRFTYSDGSTITLDSSHRRIAFARDSGALLSDGSGRICTQIEVYKVSTGYKKTIELVALTGKVKILD